MRRAWMGIVATTWVLAVGCDEEPGPSDSGSPLTDAGDGEDAGPPSDGGPMPARDAGPGIPDGGPPPDTGPPLDPPCTTFATGVSVGTVEPAELNELSGLAASRTYTDRLYAHNDSGDSARLFVLGADGSDHGEIALDGATARDFEDIAVGPGADGQSWVFVGDTGDNAARTGSGAPRANIRIYRFPEVAVDLGVSTVSAMVTPETVTLTYPDAPHDCESLAVADNGDLYLLTKEETGMSQMYVVRAPFASDAMLEPVGTTSITTPTAMDMSPGGHRLVVRGYTRAMLFLRMPDETWGDALLRGGTIVRLAAEPQGEAIAWRADGRAYFTSSEGSAEPIYTFLADPASCSAN